MPCERNKATTHTKKKKEEMAEKKENVMRCVSIRDYE
jgi:hypothetical protein